MNPSKPAALESLNALAPPSNDADSRRRVARRDRRHKEVKSTGIEDEKNATFSTGKKAAPIRQLPRRNSSRKLLPLLALGQLGRSDSFTLNAASAPLRRVSTCPNLGEDLNDCGRSATALNMNVPSFDLADVAAPLMEAAAPMVEAASNGAEYLSNLGNTFLPSSAAKTEAEAEGMNMMAHALLDLPAAMAQATVAARVAEVAGRLFVLGKDTLPGHGVLPDELAFQVAFLAVSCNTLYQTIMPKIKAAQACKFLTPGDRKAFRSLFKPTGLSWNQYREMNLHSMEWVTLEPGQTMSMEDAYWLCEGNVEIDGDKTVPAGLIGEDHIAKTLGMFNGEDVSSKVAVAGSEGAKVLKMNTNKLGRMMKHDENLQAPMGRMLFNSMQENIERVDRRNNGGCAA